MRKEWLSFLKTTKIENIEDVNIRYVSNGVAALRVAPVSSRWVGMGEFAFSTKDILYTTAAYTCAVIVVRKGEKWGIYHDVVYPESGFGDWVRNSHHERLLKFLKIMSHTNESKLNSAFLFGLHESDSKEMAEAGRIEAERALLEVGGFRKDQIFSRWNGDKESSVDVLISPVAHRIYVENVRW